MDNILANQQIHKRKYTVASSMNSSQKITKRKRSKNMSLTIPSLQILKIISYPLGFIALTLIITFLALNRDKLSSSVVDPLDDNAYQAAMASYAGVRSDVPEIAAEVLPENIIFDDASILESSIPLDLLETFSWKDYTIQRGDSISKIAASASVSMDAVIALNGMSNAKHIREGAVIRIPNMDGIPYTVQKGDNLSKISAKFEVPLEAILDANDLESEVISVGASLFIPGAKMAREDLKRALGELFLYPINGRLTSTFGWRTDPVNGVVRRNHAAIDLAAPTGTPIKASADGTISAAGMNATYGKYVIIQHGNGYSTMYAHMNKIYLNNGTKVLQGTAIGEVGNTGYSTGPHLHFGVFKNSKPVNPFEYLSK
jgi:murein DD-endopeptidase MepM/ murein hydrolase activator NlpD